MKPVNNTIRILYQLLVRVPWFGQQLQRVLWEHRARRTYRQRLQDIPKLLSKWQVKRGNTSDPQHVIFLVIDSLRKGHLSLHGYERETTPFLDSLAGNAAFFENAFTPSPWTFPAVASMLTGLYPHNHGGMYSTSKFINISEEQPNGVLQGVLALPDLLATSGFKSYFSAAVAPAAMASAGWFKHSWVFHAGANHHMKRLIKWLNENKARKTFVYLQLADVHNPINAPEPYRGTFGEIPNIPKLESWQFLEGSSLRGPDFEHYKLNRCKLYDCALRFTDTQIKRLFDYLEAIGVRDTSLIIITADHGEEFWDHVEVERKLFADPRGHYGVSHGHNVFQELINVPLICVGLGIRPGRYSHNVSLVDLPPTVLDICGIEHKLEFDGRNLFDSSDGRVLISEGMSYGYEKKAIIRDNWKLIHSEGDGVSLLFDLRRDPKERNDIAKRNPGKLEELKAFLPKSEVKGEVLEVDRDVREQLRHLGYM